MLDDNHRVAGIYQALEHAQEHVDVLEVKARGGLVQDIQRFSGGRAGQFRGQFHALALAAGQGDGALTKVNIAQADIDQGL